MYCHECGTANTVDSKYCKECGTRINDGFRTMMLSIQDLPTSQSDANVERLTRLLDMAFWHNKAGNLDAAITAGEAALAINPNSTTAHSLLGTLYEKKGDDVRAISHLESVLVLNPESAADEAKLDQLRRGVHVKAAPTPAAQLWLPPALVKLAPAFQEKWTALAGTAPLPRKPLYAAGAASLLVLASGLLLLHPWAQAEAVPVLSRPVTGQVPPPNMVAVSRSAYAASSTQDVAEMGKPVVMMPSASATTSVYPRPALTSYNPFAGTVPVSERTASSPVWSLPAVPAHSSASARRRNAHRSLPLLPLTIQPIPDSASGEVAPAPITLPSSLATVASIPQHTVMVNSLGSAAQSSDSVADLPSHIHITVHQIASGGNVTSAVSDSGGRDESGTDQGVPDQGAHADSFQQRALALQQQGDYKQARIAYQSAIRGYQSQIAAGQDIESAQRGLAACQTGLQICQQSQ